MKKRLGFILLLTLLFTLFVGNCFAFGVGSKDLNDSAYAITLKNNTGKDIGLEDLVFKYTPNSGSSMVEVIENEIAKAVPFGGNLLDLERYIQAHSSLEDYTVAHIAEKLEKSGTSLEVSLHAEGSAYEITSSEQAFMAFPTMMYAHMDDLQIGVVYENINYTVDLNSDHCSKMGAEGYDGTDKIVLDSFDPAGIRATVNGLVVHLHSSDERIGS